MIVVGEQITENDLAIMQKTGLSIWEAYKVGYIDVRAEMSGEVVYTT